MEFLARLKIVFLLECRFETNQIEAERITATETMRRADMKRTTFYKLMKEFEEQKKQAN
ncbi:hypothetical protein [Bacillus sp. AFS037270]|uniref:hypothetical protein n=1 Tax=Bacillus sp. AFS037270 TaxID=2033499 RepID=UPI001C3F41B8|nr:hypothetical protein [Bacillus sp. AFS037270]